jgi:hypothetical protein
MRHANDTNDGLTTRLVRPLYARKTVWLIFVAAMVFALALPVAITIQQSTASLAAHVSIWPAHPRAGETARLVVSLAQADDRAAARGPWAQLIATWDMTAMEMGAQQATAQGAQNDDGVLTVPLQLTMPGSWLVHATLQTPGRPAWHGTIEVIVSPATDVALSSNSASTAGNVCDSGGGTGSGGGMRI